MWKSFRKLIALALVITTTQLAFTGAVQAAMVGTDAVRAESPVPADSARARVATFLQRTDVVEQLDRLGVSSDEAQARVAAMTDDEVLSLSGKLDSMPAGGDALGTILFVGLVVFVVLLVTDILGYTKVFSFTKPMKR